MTKLVRPKTGLLRTPHRVIKLLHDLRNLLI
jgi:hypothetical protein